MNHPAGWVLAFLRRHVPAGLVTGATGDTGLIARPVSFLTWSQRHPRPGLYLAQLVVGVLTAGRGGSFVRADAQVIWYPPRSRAEDLRAGRFKAVRLEATRFDRRPRVTRRVVTSRAVIASLARSLNSLPADPGITFSCPSGTVTYRIAFVPKAAGQPPVVAVPSLCPPVEVMAGGRTQPDLLGSAHVLALVRRLLGPSVT